VTGSAPSPGRHSRSKGTGLTGGQDSRGDRRLQFRISIIGASGAIIAAAAAAVIGLKPWSPSRAPFKPSSQCAFLAPTNIVCASSDPVVILEFNNEVSSRGCAFNSEVSWGDGSPEQTFKFLGSAAGAFVIGNHKYNHEGTYSIRATSTNKSGPCSEFPANYSFTLQRR
jgi:hypothetical protein